MSSLRNLLRTLAERPAGIHSSDPALTTWSTTRVGNECAKLKFFKAKLHSRETRYFATPELRDAFIAAHNPQRLTARRRGLMWKVAGRAPWAADAEAVVTPATIFTRCPSHAPRFSEQRFAFVHG